MVKDESLEGALMHKITLVNGLLSVEGGVSMSGVSLEMITCLRELLATTSSLCKAIEGTAALDIPEIEIEYHKAQSLLKYLRESKKFTTVGVQNDQHKAQP